MIFAAVGGGRNDPGRHPERCADAAGETPEHLRLSVLGMTRRQRFAVALARPLVIAVGGSVGAVFVAVALSPLTPIGLARQAELDPGLALNVAILGAGFVALVVVLIVCTRSSRARDRDRGEAGACGAWTLRRRSDRRPSGVEPGGAARGRLGVVARQCPDDTAPGRGRGHRARGRRRCRGRHVLHEPRPPFRQPAPAGLELRRRRGEPEHAGRSRGARRAPARARSVRRRLRGIGRTSRDADNRRQEHRTRRHRRAKGVRPARRFSMVATPRRPTRSCSAAARCTRSTSTSATRSRSLPDRSGSRCGSPA